MGMEFTEGWCGGSESFDCDIRSELQSKARRSLESTKDRLSAKATAKKDKLFQAVCSQSGKQPETHGR